MWGFDLWNEMKTTEFLCLSMSKGRIWWGPQVFEWYMYSQGRNTNHLSSMRWSHGQWEIEIWVLCQAWSVCIGEDHGLSGGQFFLEVTPLDLMCCGKYMLPCTDPNTGAKWQWVTEKIPSSLGYYGNWAALCCPKLRPVMHHTGWVFWAVEEFFSPSRLAEEPHKSVNFSGRHLAAWHIFHVLLFPENSWIWLLDLLVY